MLHRTERISRTAGIILAILLFASRPCAAQEDSRTLDELLNTDVRALAGQRSLISAATKNAQTESEAPASIAVISSADILVYGYKTLDELLSGVAGFYTANDRNYSYVGTRGFSRISDYNNRILVLINGHVMNDDIYGGALMGTEFPLDMAMVERVEIVRGPQGFALFGNYAMFAVVNLILKDGITVDGLQATAGVGSFGQHRASFVFGRELGDQVNVLCSAIWGESKGEDLHFPVFDTPETGAGRATGLDDDHYRGVYLHSTWSDVAFAAGYTSRTKHVPTASYETLFGDPGFTTFDERGFADLKFAHEFTPGLRASARAYFDYTGYRGTAPYDVPAMDMSYGRWAGIDLMATHDFAWRNRITVGMEAARHFSRAYRNEDLAQLYFTTEQPMSQVSLYAQDEFQALDNLVLTAGIRFDRSTEFPWEITPRASAVYRPVNPLTLKLLVGGGFRTPGMYERYVDDPNAGYKLAQALSLERLRTVELVADYQVTTDIVARLSVYEYELRGLIDVVPDPADSLLQFRNGAPLSSHGAELELLGALGFGVNGTVSYSFQTAQEDGTGERLTNSPRHLFKTSVSRPCFDLFTLSVQALYESGRKEMRGGETTPVFLAHAGIVTAPILSRVRLACWCRNLFDTPYELPGSLDHRQDSLPQPRRTILAELHITL
jgi:outer membrane receptor for ferrienterochelin and colicins